MELPTNDSNDELSSEDDESRLLLSFSEAEEEGDDLDRLSILQDLVSSIQPTLPGTSTTHAGLPDAQESSAPSDFGFNPKRKLTVADLLPTVSDSDPLVRKSLKLFDPQNSKPSNKNNGIPAKLEVPLPKRQQGRLDRGAAYQKSKETLDRWIDTVKHNRRAAHLSFPLVDPTAAPAQGVSRLLPTSHTQPLGELENTIQNILKDSGFEPHQDKSQEDQIRAFEELRTNKLSVDEVQARRTELRKARDLLFREEVRAKRIKKIKSKSYRRVHRKQRERAQEGERAALAAAGVQLSEDEPDRNERRRAEERMGARHRESKWAKGVKDSGRAVWDEDARSGVTEMARRGEELRRRMEGKGMRNEDEDEESSISSTESSNADEDSVVGEGSVRKRRKLQRKLDVLDGGINANASDAVSRTDLSSMKFMQRAEAASKKQNDADIERLRQGLFEEEIASEDDQDVGTSGRRTFGPTSRAAPHNPKAEKSARSESEDGADSYAEDEAAIGMSAGYSTNVMSEKPLIPHTVQGPLMKRRSKQKNTVDKQVGATVHNPWLAAPNKNSHAQHSSDEVLNPLIASQTSIGDSLPTFATPGHPFGPSAKKPRLKVYATREDSKARRPVSDILPDHTDSSDENDEPSKDHSRFPVMMCNQELVKKAFAGDEVVADFEMEKRQIAIDEDERTVDTTLAGWGSWTGAGISKKEQRRNKGRFQTKVEGIKKLNRKDLKLDRVIINEKRVKKASDVRTPWHQSAC